MSTFRNPLMLLLPIALCLDAYALQNPGGEEQSHRDPSRRFELRLTSDWQVLPEREAREVDPEAAVVARHRSEKIYLAVEARRLPRIALSVWAAAWGHVASDEPIAVFLPVRRDIQARTERKLGGDWFLVLSAFRRAQGWAYRFSRYRTFDAARATRNLVQSASGWFRPLPGTAATAPRSGEAGRAPVPLRIVTGVAASLAPPAGWEAIADPDRDPTVFLPTAAELEVRDRINGYQAGLVDLGEVTRSDDLTVRLAHWLDEHLADATDFRAVDLGESVRVTCFSLMPEGRRPEGVPITWLAEGRVVDGQGIGIFAGVTGLGLDEDYDRMTRVFDGLRTVDASARPVTPVCFRDGAIVSLGHGFRLRLPVSWVPQLDDTDGTLASPSLILVARRGSAPSLPGLAPPVTARVENVPGRGAPAFAALRARLAGPDAAIVVRTLRPLEDARPTWEIDRFFPGRADRVTVTLLARPRDRGSIALVTETPQAAAARLRDEIREMHAAFRPATGDRIALTANRGAHVFRDRYEDPVRGVHFETRGAWTWSDGGHARAVDPAAVVACWRLGSGSVVRFTLAVERVPGYTVRQWAAYQRVSEVREGPDGRFYTESPGPSGREKSILEARQGWCYRATLFLPDFADPTERLQGFVPLRTFRTRDAPPRLDPDRPDATRDVTIRRHGPVAVTCPPGWCFVPIDRIENEVPIAPVLAMEHETFGYRAVLVPLPDGDSLGDLGARLESRFFREMPGGKVTRPSRHESDGVWFEATSEIPGTFRGSRLPACWLVRIARFEGQPMAALAWCKGTSLALDRPLLEQALRCMTPAPTETPKNR